MMKKISLVFVLCALFVVGCTKDKPTDPKDPQNNQQGNNEIKTPPIIEDEELPPQVPLTPDQIKSPMESIKALDTRIDGFKTGNNLTQAEIEENAKIKKDIIRGTFDIAELCKLALDKHWQAITEKDQKYFVHLMMSLLERKAILSKEQVKGSDKPYNISYLKESFINAEKTQARVETKISVPTEHVELSIHYKMLLTPYGWKIFDVIVDDSSLVDNYKYQFDTIIKKSGYPELISRMEKKLKDLN